MDINTLTQEQKDQLLSRFLNAEAAKVRMADYAKQGLAWSKNGFVVVRQGKIGDKALPNLYIHPSFIAKIGTMLASIEAFAMDQDAKNLME